MRRDTRAAWLFISPWVIGFLVFTLYPLIYSGYLSLTDYDVINDPSFVGLDNYRHLMSDPKFVLALKNTLVFAALSVPLRLVVAFFLAVLLNRAGKAAGFFRTAFFLPKMTPPVAVGIMFLLLFNGQNGLVNSVLGWFGINGPAWTTDPAWVKPGLTLMSLWTVGGSVIILLAALRNVPAELYDAALFYAIYLFQQAFEFLHMGYASAMAWILFVIIMVVTFVQIRVTRRFVFLEGEQR